jgi:hypothetical protein
VGGVDASRFAAEMVDHEAGRDRTDEHLVGEAVRVGPATVRGDDAISSP